MKTKEHGHSLVELTVVMALAAVLLSIAIPQFATAAARYRGRSVATEFAAELRMARLLAMTRGRRVEVHLGPDGQSLDLTLGGEPPSLLRRYDFRGRGVTVIWPDERSLWFHPSGRAASAATITLRGMGEQRWRMTVSLTGRVGVS